MDVYSALFCGELLCIGLAFSIFTALKDEKF